MQMPQFRLTVRWIAAPFALVLIFVSSGLAFENPLLAAPVFLLLASEYRPRKRFTIRRLMIYVAASAVACEVAVVGWTFQKYGSLASSYSGKESIALIEAEGCEGLIQIAEDSVRFAESMLQLKGRVSSDATWTAQISRGQKDIERDRAQLAQKRRQAAFFHRLASKYARAARYPWLPVEPDPPEPK